MAAVIVIGGGFGGCAAALALARDGHEVTVLERDPAPPPASPEEAWTDWERRGVAQMRMAHLLHPRGRHVLDAELPDVVDRLVDVGGLRMNPLDRVRAPGDPARDPDDDRFSTTTARRTTLEWVLATLAGEEPGVDVRRGVAVRGFVPGPAALAGVPHVAGVRLEGGGELRADLVVDATGRRSPTLRWLEELGGRLPEEDGDDCGFVYHGRFLRSPDGSLPPFLAPPLTPLGSMSVLCLPSDSGTWTVTVYALAADAPLRRLRDRDTFDRVIRACPAHAHWLDGEPISGMMSMAGGVDRERDFAPDGHPVVTGLLPLADAWACTNPSLGRGMSFALMHMAVLRSTVREHLDDPAKLSIEFHARTREELRPWHEATCSTDRARLAEMRAIVAGEPVPEHPVLAISQALARASAVDVQALRWMAEIQGCLSLPTEVLGRPGALDHVMAAAQDAPTVPGPDRAALLELVA